MEFAFTDLIPFIPSIGSIFIAILGGIQAPTIPTKIGHRQAISGNHSSVTGIGPYIKYMIPSEIRPPTPPKRTRY
jgi:hypothetical protein